MLNMLCGGLMLGQRLRWLYNIKTTTLNVRLCILGATIQVPTAQLWLEERCRRLMSL